MSYHPKPFQINKKLLPKKEKEEENKNKKFVISYLVMAFYRITQNTREKGDCE